MFYLMKSKYAIFSNIKVTKIERSAFFGTPGIDLVSVVGFMFCAWVCCLSRVVQPMIEQQSK